MPTHPTLPCPPSAATGHFVSGFVKKQLPMLLVNHLGKHSVQDALRASFLEVDANLGASSIDCEFSGCTCAVAHLQVCVVD